jgi:C1A family cysteine protease
MLALAFLLASTISGYEFASADGAQQFEEFKATYAKVYESTAEHEKRAMIFQQSLDRIADKLLSGDDTAGVTKFADLTPAEFRKRLNFHPPSKSSAPRAEFRKPTIAVDAIPNSVDWRNKSAVTPVKNQGDCGSCWAFSIVEEIESAWFLAGNPLTVFSTQQVVSCDKGDSGCDGGDTLDYAPAYIEKAGGLALEKTYPYTSGKSGKTEKCKAGFQKAGGNIKGHTWATPSCPEGGACKSQDLGTLKANLASHAPASICVNAHGWQDYKSGVFSSKACGKYNYNSMDHCVQLVGYTPTSWLVRNSWGSDYGVDGYIHLEVGENTCGVADYATFYTINNSTSSK